MRSILLLMCVIILSAIGGCHGASTESVHPVVPAGPFAGLPGPAALLAMDGQGGPAAGKSATSMAMYMGSQFDAALPHSDNVAADPVSMRTSMPGRRLPLTFCIFRVAPHVVPAGMLLRDIQVDYSFVDTEPDPPDGLYLGISDFAANRWAWVELAAHGRIVDLAPLGVSGNDGPEYLVFVNYSNSGLEIASIDLEFGPDSTAGDWIYYTQYPVFTPAEPTGIARVRTDGSTQPETILTGIMDTGYCFPRVRHLPAGDELYCNRNILGSIDICRYAMDGSGETVHRSSPPNVAIMDWSDDGGIELYTTGDSVRTGWWYNWTAMSGGAFNVSNGNIVEMVLDPFDAISTYAVYMALEQPVPETTVGLFHVGTDTLPWTGDADTVVYDGTEFIRSICCGRIPGGTGVDLTGAWFVSDTRNPDNPLDQSDNLYIAPTFSAGLADYLVYEAYDFTGFTISPDGSRIAFMVREPGDAAWDIYVTPTLRQHDWQLYSPVAEDDCWGDLEWYHPST